MRVLVIDDEITILKDNSRIIEQALKEKYVDEEIIIDQASTVIIAKELIDQNYYDIIFSDIDMPKTNGILLSQEIEEKQKNANLVFITGYPQYSVDAWKTYACGFLLKPIMKKDIIEVSNRFTKDVSLRKIEVTCFGNFDVKVNGETVNFKRKKSMEFFALLIDACGIEVSSEKLRVGLWEFDEDTDKKKNYIRALALDIKETFASLGFTNIIINTNGGYKINKKYITCDYYQEIDKGNREKPLNYMNQYDWSKN